jgi:exosortase
LIVGLALIGTLVYWPSTAALFQAWTDFETLSFTHGFLMLAVALGLLIHSRKAIAAAPSRPWPLAGIALLIGSLLWLIFYRAAIQDLHVAMFPGLIWAAVAAAFGWQVARLMVVPFVLIYLAVPSWIHISGLLQWLTVCVTHGLMEATAFPATVSGNLIQIPVGSFLVEEGCSGLHFLIVGLAVATFYGELRGHSLRVRLVLVGVMGSLALAANWVRVYVVVVSGYLTHMHSHLVAVSHYWFGWKVFVVALIVFLWIAGRFSASVPAEPREVLATASPSVSRCSNAGTFALAVLALVVVPSADYALRVVRGAPPALRVEFVPGAAGAPRRGASDSAWQPSFAGADDQQRAVYGSAPGELIEAFGAAYAEQHQGSELVGESSTVFGDSGLRTVAQSRVSSAGGEFDEARVVDKKGQESLIWYRYQVGARELVTPLAEQLSYGAGSVVGDPVSSVFALRAICLPDCGAARRHLQELAQRRPMQILTRDRGRT